MNRLYLITLAIGLIVSAVIGMYLYGQKSTRTTALPNTSPPITDQSPSNPSNSSAGTETSSAGSGNQEVKKELIVIDQPKANAVIKSPLTITGRARGNWYFEADFPIRLIDANGKELGHSIAQAQGEWMTENFVPFTSTLSFNVPTAGQGTLILEKSNPSGLPQNADEVRIPVSWEATASRNILLYYYNKTKDPNTTCHSDAVLPVTRSIPSTISPIQDAIKLLIRGEITTAESVQGIDSEFPLPGVELKGAVLRDGTLTLEFADPQNKLSGGACRVGLLKAEVEKTARQFPEVQSIRYIPSGLLQP